MTAIRAIETRYKGYRFRSRLEARWAVFFETLGIQWEYEPQGFVIGWSDTKQYLPDFRVTLRDGQWFWVEVKGDPSWLANDGLDFLEMFDFGGGPPGFSHSFDSYETGHQDSRGALLLLGSIPHDLGDVLEISIIGHREGVWRTKGHLIHDSAGAFLLVRDSYLCDVICGKEHSCGDWDFQPKAFYSGNAESNILLALQSAKSARFEHGETPR